MNYTLKLPKNEVHLPVIMLNITDKNPMFLYWELLKC